MITLDEVLLKKEQAEKDILDFIGKTASEFYAQCGTDMNRVIVEFDKSQTVGQRDRYYCLDVRVGINI